MTIKGFLVSDPKELSKIAREKKRSRLFTTESKTNVRITKEKSKDIVFEDRVWLLFKNLGFTELNRDRNCCLVYKSGHTKQIDVLAVDRQQNQVFVIDCQTGQNNPLVARSKLKELAGDYDDIKKAIEAHWFRGIGRINLLVVIDSTDKRKKDQDYASAKKNLMLWSLSDIEYIERLIKQTGSIAKNQLYSILFSRKKQKTLGQRYLALRGRMAGYTFYLMLISAKDLINYAHIHHRELTEIVEASQAYQRMLNKNKLKQIMKYIDEIGGSFPNTIIVNFLENLQWEKSQKSSKGKNEVETGFIRLPPYYGCAWIIDGQHRLYGAAKAEGDTLLPVLAFESMNEKEQAELFVDINKKQTSVPDKLLWDLYSDIYKDSDDEKQRKQYQIAETAKRLRNKGPLKGLIDIPSIPSVGAKKLSLATVCTNIEKFAWDYLYLPNDDPHSSEHAARIFNAYFNAQKKQWPDEWAKASDGLFLSNAGFGVFMVVFQDIIRHLEYKDKKTLKTLLRSSNSELLKKEFGKYLEWPILCLKEDERYEDLKQSIKSSPGLGPRNKNAQGIDTLIKEEIEDFSPPRLGEEQHKEQLTKKVSTKSLREKASSAERIFREFVLRKLESSYGDKWWKQGLPGSLKKKLDEEWLHQQKRNPELRRRQQVNEVNKNKFEYLSMGDVAIVAIYGQNWEDVFEGDFADRTKLQERINDVLALRNPSSHNRSLTEQDILDGKAGLNWLAGCLARSDLKPSV